MSLELDKTYLRAIVDTSAFATPGKPEGFSNHYSASSADNVIIRQNNTIIALLLEINSKLDKILKEKTPAVQQDQSGIDELITKLNKIQITPLLI